MFGPFDVSASYRNGAGRQRPGPAQQPSGRNPACRIASRAAIGAASQMLPLLFALACSNGAPPPKSASLPVVVGEVSRGPATIRVTLDGEVLDAGDAEVGAEVAGTVLAVPARVGQSVAKGSVIVQLDPRPFRIALDQAEAMAMDADAEVAVRRAALDRARASQLPVIDVAAAERSAVSPREEEEARLIVAEAGAALQAAEAQRAMRAAGVQVAALDLSRATMRAPVDGVVSQQWVKIGQRVAPGTPCVAVAATGALEVLLDAGEAWTGRVSPGAAVALRVPAREDLAASGTVAGIVPAAQGTGRTQRLRVLLDAAPTGLLPGMAVRGEVVVAELADALAVPRDAVVNGAVFVVDGDKARKVPVTILDAGRDSLVVEATLLPGEKVVVRGNEALSDGGSVSVLGAGPAATAPPPSSPRP